jgi:uncharacterized damage-inducible protein DinB
MPTTEVWQRGPIPGVDPYLMPVAHAFLQVKEDFDRLVSSVPEDKIWHRPGGAASIGFHIRHIGGATDRLLTYARGEALSADQVAAARAEGTEAGVLHQLVRDAQAVLDRALQQVRDTSAATLLAERKVGRAGLPSTTLGLLFHAAEHATRHMGQAITTAIVVGGGASQGA